MAEVRVYWNQKYLNIHPWLNTEALQDGLTKSSWTLPKLELSTHIVGMGTTGHQGMPSEVQLDIPDHPKLPIFAKPFENFEDALREYRNSNLAIQRRVPTPYMVALMEIDDQAILVSELLKNVLPLSARRLDWSLQDPRVYSPREFLKDFVGFMGRKLHDQGVNLGDVHLGNLGDRFIIQRPTRPIVFDLETATVLNQQDLSMKNSFIFRDEKQQKAFEVFETVATDDIASFAAHLTKSNFPMGKEEMLINIASIYEDNRRPSYGLISGNDLIVRLATRYDHIVQALSCRMS